jgi:3-methyladenine DNA glycosylase AlkD
MSVSVIVREIREELLASVDQKTKETAHRFFKESVTFYGVKTGTVTGIAKRTWKTVKAYDKDTIYGLCEELYRSGILEEAFIVTEWGHHFKEFNEKQDIDRYIGWIHSYITNWATCDGLCNHAFGDLIMKFPELVDEMLTLAKSENRWVKRAAAVSLVLPVRKGGFLRETFEICDILLLDPDDLVRKGYGWLLKEASRLHQEEVFDYVIRNKRSMPRTALRYAIELMPEDMRKNAMQKD